MDIRFPGETAEYRSARRHLLRQEIDLRRAMEKVAEARRALPRGGVVPEDYVFAGRRSDGTVGDVRLSDLFGDGRESVALYSFMFPRYPTDDRPGPPRGSTALLPLAEAPCPSCTALLDQLDGAAPHLDRRMGFAVVAKAPPERLLAFGEERGWRNLRLLSSAGSRYNRDYFGENSETYQQPMLNVFHRDGGVVRHFWGSEMLYAPTEANQEPRHVGTLEPLWNMFDLIPEGRGSGWEEQLDYDCCRQPGPAASAN
jgi:predicted dithiol-disulfide oxidoreductase (DUF899 family)